MKGDPIQETDNVCRYSKPSWIDELGRATLYLFTLRPEEQYLSCNWLEYFDEANEEERVQRVREAFISKGYTLKRSGAFFVANVGTLQSVCPGTEILHEPIETDEVQDPSHCGIFGLSSDDLIAAAEIAEIFNERFYPGWIDPT
jgi:hypothetical protein